MVDKAATTTPTTEHSEQPETLCETLNSVKPDYLSLAYLFSLRQLAPGNSQVECVEHSEKQDISRSGTTILRRTHVTVPSLVM